MVTNTEAVRQLVRKLSALELFMQEAPLVLTDQDHITYESNGTVFDILGMATIDQAVQEITTFLFETGNHEQVLETLWDSERTEADLKRTIAEIELGLVPTVTRPEEETGGRLIATQPGEPKRGKPKLVAI